MSADEKPAEVIIEQCIGCGLMHGAFGCVACDAGCIHELVAERDDMAVFELVEKLEVEVEQLRAEVMRWRHA